MRRARLATPTLAALATLLAGVAAAPLHAAPASGGYTAPRNGWGQPDLSGNWTNVSLTPEQRDPKLGAKSSYTPEEVAAKQKAVDAEVAEGNKNSDPNAGAPTKGGDKLPANTRPEFAAAGGAVGGYDRGWLDPGSRIMTVNGEARTSVLTTPDGRVPKGRGGMDIPADYRHYANRFDNPEWMSLGERCVMGFGRNAGPPMLANGFYNNDYQIIETPTEVAIVIEMVHDVRHIRLNAQHRTDGLRPWMGDTVGHWEGDTLVAETTNFPESMGYHGAWRDLKVTERFTRKGPNRLLYQFVVDAPSTWDKPWGGEYEFHPLDGQIYEYACHEGNYALEHMLAGARAEETKKTGAEAPAPAGAAKSGD